MDEGMSEGEEDSSSIHGVKSRYDMEDTISRDESMCRTHADSFRGSSVVVLTSQQIIE